MTLPTDVERFLRDSGFKILAFARLSQCEYSLMLYLLNCSVSGLDQIITNEMELASLLGFDVASVDTAIAQLNKRGMLRLSFSDQRHPGEKSSLRIGIQYDTSTWEHYFATNATSSDAIIYPFRRQGAAILQVLDGQKGEKQDRSKAPTWKRIIDAFMQDRFVEDRETSALDEAAKVLVETHPVDQVLLMLRHFNQRIPTLSLLASSWQHYQELFEEETQKVDMLGARQKHNELDDKLRDRVKSILDQIKEEDYSEEELSVLRILSQHRHPRRQLFWAYQLRTRYPKLADFFHENAGLMLPVTTSGAKVRWNHDEPE